MGDTKIAWTNKTWNPITGCSHVSEGCRHCFAERLALRYGWSKKPWTAENARENVVLHPERLEQPLHWRKPRRVFVNSMSDLFHEQVPIGFIWYIFGVMAVARRHVFQVLTKRPKRMLEILSDPDAGKQIVGAARVWASKMGDWLLPTYVVLPLPNVWLGVSVENQRAADERIPLLLQTPAAVRFVSCEPLLERVRLRETWLDGQCDHPCAAYMNGDILNCGCVNGHPPNTKLDQIIVGGESGPGFRPMDLDWARSIRDQCIVAGVPFWFKQVSANKPGTGAQLDGVIWNQFPE